MARRGLVGNVILLQTNRRRRDLSELTISARLKKRSGRTRDGVDDFPLVVLTRSEQRLIDAATGKCEPRFVDQPDKHLIIESDRVENGLANRVDGTHAWGPPMVAIRAK